MSRHKYIIELVTKIVGDVPTAIMVVEALQTEGVLALGYGDKEVETILEAFKVTFGTTKITRYDRFAAHRLAEKYNAQAVVGIIRLLAENSTEKYHPVVNSVAQLEEKMPSVLNFLRKQSDETPIDA